MRVCVTRHSFPIENFDEVYRAQTERLAARARRACVADELEDLKKPRYARDCRIAIKREARYDVRLRAQTERLRRAGYRLCRECGEFFYREGTRRQVCPACRKPPRPTTRECFLCGATFSLGGNSQLRRCPKCLTLRRCARCGREFPHDPWRPFRNICPTCHPKTRAPPRSATERCARCNATFKTEGTNRKYCLSCSPKPRPRRARPRRAPPPPPPPVELKTDTCRACGKLFDARGSTRVVCESCADNIAHVEAERLRRDAEGVPNVAKTRRCLKCRKKFRSAGAENRLCGSCRNNADAIEHRLIV